MLAESANRTKKGGQDLIGGLDVRVNRNHFGRQTESFQAPLDLPFLDNTGKDVHNGSTKPKLFNGVFIRAPVVEKLLPNVAGVQQGEAILVDTVIAPSKSSAEEGFPMSPVEVLGVLPGRGKKLQDKLASLELRSEVGDIIVVQQGNVLGTSFHPELTNDDRIHVWWLKQVLSSMNSNNGS